MSSMLKRPGWWVALLPTIGFGLLSSVWGMRAPDLSGAPENLCDGTHAIVGVMSEAPTPTCAGGPPWLRPVRVERWIKGSGPDTVWVASFSGPCLGRGSNGETEVLNVVNSDQGGLPAPGTRVLLVMSPYAGSSSFQTSRLVLVTKDDAESAGAIERIEQACRDAAKPNNALQPSGSSVTPPAKQASRQPAGG